MASVKQRGKNSWLITVSEGRSAGKKLTQTKTVKIDPVLTPKQRERELERLAAEFENQVKKGLVFDENITLKEFSDNWLKEYASKQLQPKTIKSYKEELESKILPALGHKKMIEIQPVQILGFLNNLFEEGIRKDGKAGAYSNRTVKYQHQILSSIFQTAVYWMVLPANPCERVKVPKQGTGLKKQNFFNEEQTIMFLEAIHKEELKFQVIANITLYGVLREGEVLALTWDDIDFDECMIRISKALQYVSGTGTFIKEPKNKSSIRVISLPENVFTLLKKYRAWQLEQKLKFGWSKEWEETKLLFTKWDGTPMGYQTPYRWFKDFVSKYNYQIEDNQGIPENEKQRLFLPAITYHGLRHTSATLLIAEKMDIKTVSARLGHSQTSTTLDIYSHSLKNSDRKAATALKNLLERKKENTQSKQA